MWIALMLLGAALAHPTFQEWKSEYGKTYESAEEERMREGIYMSNMAEWDRLTLLHKAEFGANVFADWTVEEFKGHHNLQNVPTVRGTAEATVPLEATPSSWDWRKDGKTKVISEVYNQGNCGSCWAFSVAGNMEAMWAIAGNQFTPLSMQQLVDCDHECGTYPLFKPNICDQGCAGGCQPNAYKYIIQNGLASYVCPSNNQPITLGSQEDYPYTAANGQCAASSKKMVAHAKNYTLVANDQESKLQPWLYEVGPIAIAVDALSWQFYKGGVMDNCKGSFLDHGVLLVGYGTDSVNGTDYWIIKNSWGPMWGEQGYMRAKRGMNSCGLSNFPSTLGV